jgi:hypothetical protein
MATTSQALTTLRKQNTMSLSRDKLLAPLQVKREKVELPEFGEGEFVFVHGMTAREKNAHDSSLMNAKWTGVDRVKVATSKERMIVKCVRDETGQPIFQPDDVEAISQWPADVANRVFDVANRLSGGATDVEAAAKN